MTQLALVILILRKAEIDDLTIEQIGCLHESVIDNVTSPINASKSPALIRVVEKIEAVQHSASNESRTAALWMQYVNQVMLMRDFIRAERCGDWKLHLATIRKMFHISIFPCIGSSSICKVRSLVSPTDVDIRREDVAS